MLKTVLSSWRSDCFQKLQPSPLGTGKMILTQARRDSTLRTLRTGSAPVPRGYSPTWNLGREMGKAPQIHSGQDLTQCKPTCSCEVPMSASYLEGEAHSNYLNNGERCGVRPTLISAIWFPSWYLATADLRWHGLASESQGSEVNQGTWKEPLENETKCTH